MSDAIAAMKQALMAISEKSGCIPPRIHMSIGDRRGTTLVMPAHVTCSQDKSLTNESLTVKVASIFDGNPEQHQMQRIQAAVLVISPETGQPVALMDGARITAIRTAATSAAATDVLARENCRQLSILGAGVQARAHIEAVCSVRPIEAISVWSRRAESAQAMVDEMSLRHPKCRFRLCASADQAVQQADIVCATTNADIPLFTHHSIAPGAHINAIGSYHPDTREVPTDTVVAAVVFVEEMESALEEAGDLIQPIREGRIGEEHIRGTVGQVLLGQCPGRENDDQITLFKSVGNAAEDALAASTALANAKRLGLGQDFQWT